MTDMKTLRRRLGERAFAAVLAKARAGALTNKDAAALARKYLRKGRTLKATTEDAFAAAGLVIKGRSTRSSLRRRSMATYPVNLTEPHWLQTHRRGLSFWGTRLDLRLSAARQELENERLRRVQAHLSWLVGGRHAGVERVERLPADAPFTAATAEAWSSKGDRYSGRCPFRKTEANFRAKIPADYEASVGANGLARVHGLVTLAALPVESDRPGEEIFRARWVRKTAGFAFATEDGYIVRRGGEATHGGSIAACRAQLTRRENEAQLDRLEAEIIARLAKGDGALGSLGAVIVDIADSVRAGNCRPGTLAFRDRHFPGQDRAPVKDVLAAAVSSDSRRYAILACWQAIRRARKAGLDSPLDGSTGRQ